MTSGLQSNGFCGLLNRKCVYFVLAIEQLNQSFIANAAFLIATVELQLVIVTSIYKMETFIDNLHNLSETCVIICLIISISIFLDVYENTIILPFSVNILNNCMSKDFPLEY